ncbi:monocarboxylate transporter 12-B-like [Glandiceps talaboti]
MPTDVIESHQIRLVNLFSGTGCGLAYMASVEFVSMYFKKRLAIVLGISLAGASAGQFALCMISQNLLDSYGWRGTLLILSGLTLNISVAGALMIMWPMVEEKSHSPNKELMNEAVLIDLSLLREPVYWFQIFIVIGQGFAHGTIIVHLVRRARDYGISDTHSALIPAVMGLIQVVTRPLWGLIGHIHGLRANIPYGISMTVCGVITIISTYTRTFAGQIIFILIYGICNGGFRVFMTLVVSSFLGHNKIGYGTSLLYQVTGFTILLISPFAGWIRDETGVYDWAFWIAGIAILLAAVLAFLLPVIEKVVERKRQRRTTHREETNITAEE